ncbi:hypothetical protein NHX12_013208 [Muraenolepis orangiensis]|uniref:Serine/threonine-protein phosphatase 4 regulatory subunit 2 n=1 Tax=Muraenolepis orangiensis TaxID=630683 RepID=A0A9Q0DFS3_9TELE|nr:hypothetical protein NHX12_013208 [Muraenolepis orangiensis]
MEIDAILEAVRDFEKKETKETCPVLEQLLVDVAKTGETFIPWSKFKTYFLFKMENVIDDFQASAPEQRGSPHPNVVYVPFDSMKERIVKLVDSYSGVPFTIQRLCELLTDPTRNYTGSEKFLRGVEKNVMVVSCVRPPSEKHGDASGNRMNGGTFPGCSSVLSDSHSVNGPAFTAKPSAISLSRNGLPGGLVSRERQLAAEDRMEHHTSGPTSPEAEEGSPRSSGEKSKRWGEEDCCDRPLQEVKRLKVEPQEEEAEDEGDTRASAGDVTEMRESTRDACRTVEEAASSGAIATSEHSELCSTESPPSNRPEDSSDSAADPDLDLALQSHMTTDQSEPFDRSGPSLTPESLDNVEGSSSSSDEGMIEDNQPPSSPCSTADLPTEGTAESKLT